MQTVPNNRSLSFPDILYASHLQWGHTPTPPKGAPAAVSRPFRRVKTSPRSEKVRKINPDNSYQEIANGLPWLSYAGGLGGGSPPVLISLILCLLKVKAKKSTLLKCNEREFTPEPWKSPYKYPNYEAIFCIFIGNPLIRIAAEGNLS